MKAEIIFEAGQHSRQVFYWCLVVISTIPSCVYWLQ